MRIGDRVRLLHGTEEGRIVGIKGKIVDVEIDDGFIIPALQNEIVLIDKNEANSFQREEPVSQISKPHTNDDFIAEGIYLGFEEIQESFFESFFINQTANTLLYSISQYDKKISYAVSFGICDSYKKVSIGKLTSSIFNDSKRLIIQIVIHENQSRLKKQPLNIVLEIKKEQLTNTVYLASLEKHLSLVNLAENRVFKFNPMELSEKMMENTSFDKKRDDRIKLKELTVDLHIENIGVELKSNEILDYQLAEFEKAYDRALVSKCGKIEDYPWNRRW